MKVLNRSNIFFLIAVIVLSSMIFYTRHYGWPFTSDAKSIAIELATSSNPFIDVVILISNLLFMGTFFLSEDKNYRIFLWGVVLVGIVIMSVALFIT